MHDFEMTTPRASLEDNVWSIQIMPEETIRKQIMSAGGGGDSFCGTVSTVTLAPKNITRKQAGNVRAHLVIDDRLYQMSHSAKIVSAIFYEHALAAILEVIGRRLVPQNV